MTIYTKGGVREGITSDQVLLRFFNHFEAEQGGHLLDGAFQVAIEGNTMSAPLVPILH
jgi:hypothetical protein